MYKFPYLFLFSVALLSGCGKAEPTDQSVLWLDSKHSVVFLDRAHAAEAILADSSDHFFDLVGIVDMCLQMGEATSGAPRDTVLLHYRSWLTREASAFNGAEQGLVSSAVRRAFNQVNERLRGVFPPEFKVAKIKGQAYGEEAFFTREDVIFIPEPQLNTNDPEVLASILTHEIWHIISRKNPQVRAGVYEAFGFQRLDAPLLMDSAFRQRLLLNPDAPEPGWAISMKIHPDSAEQKAVAIIYADSSFIPAGAPFFESMNMHYFPLIRQDDGWQLAQEGAFMPMSIPDFLTRTGGNTGYIIHPEEIAADNFVLLASDKKEGISPEGQAALNRLEQALWQWVSTARKQRRG